MRNQTDHPDWSSVCTGTGNVHPAKKLENWVSKLGLWNVKSEIWVPERRDFWETGVTKQIVLHPGAESTKNSLFMFLGKERGGSLL